MRVLSLFDGMSCGQIALKELGIIPEVYYASEIDKYAIAMTKYNFPNTIHLGDVRNVDARKLGHIDMLIGGSPCTNFSFAGRRNGMNTSEGIEIYTLEHYLQLKAEGFEFDGESFLFWEYMRILGEVRETNPNVIFFLENVEMGEKWENVLTKAIGIKGIHINAALLSAQTRKRIYWTNIKTKQDGFFGWIEPDIEQPKDRGIVVQDILEDEVDEKYYLKQEIVDRLLGNAKDVDCAEEGEEGDSSKAEEGYIDSALECEIAEGEDLSTCEHLEGERIEGQEDLHS